MIDDGAVHVLDRTLPLQQFIPTTMSGSTVCSARYSVGGVLVVALLLCACSGPSRSQPAEPDDRAEEDRATSNGAAFVSQFETFDPSQYPVERIRSGRSVRHDVPRRLLRGRADEGAKQTLEGFRIQVFSARDQEVAQRFREQVREWWEQAQADAPQGVFREQPPIVIEYAQPYYRVRIGAFARQETAADALSFLKDKYPGAFVARSTVTVVR